MKMFVRFRSLECTGCGARRQAGMACADCGERPRDTEVDDLWQARVRRLNSAKPSEVIDLTGLTASEVLSREDSLPGGILTAARDLAGDRPEGVEAWAAVTAEVLALKIWVATTTSLRPVVTLTEAVRRVVTALVAEHQAMEDSLAEPGMREAHRKSEAIQLAIDEAEAAASDAADLVELMGQVMAAEDLIGGWLAAIADGDIMSVFERGRESYRAHARGDCGENTSLLALIWDRVVSVVGSPDSFWQMVVGHRTLLEQHQTGLRAILSDPLYQARADEAAHDLWSAVRRLSDFDAETAREDVTAVLELGHTVVEQALKVQLGVACALTTRMSFARTQATDVSELANIARDRQWAVSRSTQGVLFRNAFAHRDYEVVGDVVQLSPRHCRAMGRPLIEVTPAEVLDAVIALIEIGGAMELALGAVAEPLLPNSQPIPPRSLARTTLVGAGWSQVAIEIHDTTVEVSATVPSTQSISMLAFVASPFSRMGSRLRLRLTRTDVPRSRVIELRLEDFRRWRADYECGKEQGFIAMCASTTFDGDPIMSPDHVAKVTAFRGCELVVDRDLPTQVRVGRLGEWRRLAADLGLNDVARALGVAQRWRLYADSGMTSDPAELEPLLALAGMSVPPIPGTLI